MKNIRSLTLLLLALATATASPLSAQSYEEGITLYTAAQYEDAFKIFEQLNDETSSLFAGKSLLATGQYSPAVSYLYEALNSSSENIRLEARYSLSIAHFRLKNYHTSLGYLHQLLESNNRTGLTRDARRFYNQILNYLSTEERLETLRATDIPGIRFDLVNNAKPYVTDKEYEALVNELIGMERNSSIRAELEERLVSNVDLDTVATRYPEAPEGMIYHIGVILPTFDVHDPDFTVSRNLYYGMILAAEEFNSSHNDKKVQLLFKSSAEDATTTASAFTELVESNYVSVVIGPLFSDPARRAAQLAEEYKIPMIAPLANSDDLNRGYDYTFQLNPTFEVHGRKMARFAIDELGLTKFAVIVEKGSLGAISALNFQREAERLGAEISIFFEEDFDERSYDLTSFSGALVSDPSDPVVNELPVQAIYAPFTGETTPTLTRLLLNELESMDTNLVILGSEGWANADISPIQRHLFGIYYSKAIGETERSDGPLFRQHYQERFGSSPDRFSKIGFDAARFLFYGLETAGNPAYLRHIFSSEPYEGISLKIDFDGQQVNQYIDIVNIK